MHFFLRKMWQWHRRPHSSVLNCTDFLCHLGILDLGTERQIIVTCIQYRIPRKSLEIVKTACLPANFAAKCYSFRSLDEKLCTRALVESSPRSDRIDARKEPLGSGLITEEMDSSNRFYRYFGNPTPTPRHHSLNDWL